MLADGTPPAVEEDTVAEASQPGLEAEPHPEADFADLTSVYDAMSEEAGILLSAGQESSHQLFLDLRYAGQEFTITVPVELEQLLRADRAGIRASFDQLHQQRYAHHSTELDREELRGEEFQRARRHLQSVEKGAVIESFQRGIISQTVQDRLLADIDAELLRIESGEPDMAAEQSTPAERVDGHAPLEKPGAQEKS